MQLVAAGYRQLNAELHELKTELRRVREDRDQWRTQFYEERVRAEGLATKAKEQPRRQRIQNAALSIGGVVAGLGFPLTLVASTRPSGMLITCVGSVLMWIGATRLTDGD